ncbi:Hypothetical protein FKW44_002761 [Caligus rogercresseyi]|uniref:Uncharacterized protein n=1 Tax=Caligus rogercresseyi TaxID=217165 RepID=A0A7T8KKL6_CALRO|nr:Hypothetical protein FKW44_002761 [Caligus rogercresseyi]
MRQKVIPWIKKVAGDRPYVSSRMGACTYLQSHSTFMDDNLKFWAKDMWPPQSQIEPFGLLHIGARRDQGLPKAQ